MVTAIATGYRVLYKRFDSAESGWTVGWQDYDLLIPVSVEDAIAPAWPRATVELNLPAVADFCWNWKDYIAPDDAIAIVSDHVKAADRHVLFAGFVTEARWSFDGKSQSCIITANGLPFRLARDGGYMVYRRSMVALDGESVRDCIGLECNFNAGGRPNRSADRVNWTMEDGYSGESYMFVDDYDGDAQPWTALEAIEYLLQEYNYDELWLTNPTFTAEQLAGSPPVQVDVDGMSLWEAVAKIANHGGYDLACVLDYADGAITGTLAVTARGEGGEVTVHRQPPNADGTFPALDADQTNLFAADVVESAASCVTVPIVAGGRELYEITIELGKAWDPTKLALTAGEYVMLPGSESQDPDSQYVSRFVIGGATFNSYAEVGRLWDGNTDGQFSAEPYSLDVTDVAAAAGQTAESWPAMPYEPHRLITRVAATPLSAGQESFLEYSIDAGATWHRMSGYRLLRGRLGVYLTTANLAGIVPAGGAEATDNLFQKLIDSPANVKLRLTCTVASPDRATSNPDRRSTAGTRFFQAAYFDKGHAGQVRAVAEGSALAASGLTADTSDGGTTLDDYAAQIQDINEDRFIEAQLNYEWVVEPSQMPLGGVVKTIGGIDVPLGVNAGAAQRYPRIVARKWSLTPQTYSTQISLDTDRQMPVLPAQPKRRRR